ncbi:hypothetical protein EPI10_029283 [Gossypium australe]|uniref:Uncharacterized protein n=1 Tax=Gossypium australe TaxID=47621 RepID=A0A5B6V123_9ROSI|nr:hypothetical protein EPI10_029283 [Gossypium australe]
MEGCLPLYRPNPFDPTVWISSLSFRIFGTPRPILLTCALFGPVAAKGASLGPWWPPFAPKGLHLYLGWLAPHLWVTVTPAYAASKLDEDAMVSSVIMQNNVPGAAAVVIQLFAATFMRSKHIGNIHRR